MSAKRLWKYVVAREGLIILGVVALSALLGGISLVVPTNDESVTEKLIAESLASKDFKKKPLLDEAARRGMKDIITVERLGELIKHQYPEYNDKTNRQLGDAFLAKYPDYTKLVTADDFLGPSPRPNYQTRFEIAAWIVLLTFYPLYILGRFIKWAVHVVRETNE